MKAIRYLFVLSVFMFNPGCSQIDPVTGNQPGEYDALIAGTWECVIPALPPVIPGALTVAYTLDTSDNTCSMLIDQANGPVPLATLVGTWITSHDTVVMTGTRCFIVDTSAAPDTLMPMDDSLCGSPIYLPIHLPTPTSWPVTIRSLGSLVYAFPIPSTMYGTTLVFTKR